MTRTSLTPRSLSLLALLAVGPLVLSGCEVKSLGAGLASLYECYCRFRGGEVWLVGAHITEYQNAGYAGHEPTRERKLLLHAHEIKRIGIRVTERGFTLIPLKLYWKDARVKLSIGLGKGKRQHDKRADVAERESKRDLARALKEANR